MTGLATLMVIFAAGFCAGYGCAIVAVSEAESGSQKSHKVTAAHFSFGSGFIVAAAGVSIAFAKGFAVAPRTEIGDANLQWSSAAHQMAHGRQGIRRWRIGMATVPFRRLRANLVRLG